MQCVDSATALLVRRLSPHKLLLLSIVVSTSGFFVLLSRWKLEASGKGLFVYKPSVEDNFQNNSRKFWFPSSGKCDDILYKPNTTVMRELDLTDDLEVFQRTNNCAVFIEKYKFVLTESRVEERLFPIAYSILVHQNIHQLVLLLSSIYTTDNYYCIHVDAKAERKTWLAAVAVSSCFENIFVTQQREAVVYAGISRLQADLNCFQDLLRFKSWKYLINLCGQVSLQRAHSANLICAYIVNIVCEF